MNIDTIFLILQSSIIICPSEDPHVHTFIHQCMNPSNKNTLLPCYVLITMVNAKDTKVNLDRKRTDQARTKSQLGQYGDSSGKRY